MQQEHTQSIRNPAVYDGGSSKYYSSSEIIRLTGLINDGYVVTINITPGLLFNINC